MFILWLSSSLKGQVKKKFHKTAFDQNLTNEEIWENPFPQNDVTWRSVLSRSAVSDSFVTLWTTARQVPLSMEFLRQEYWSGLPFPLPGDRPSPGIEPASPVPPTLQVDSSWLRHGGSKMIPQNHSILFDIEPQIDSGMFMESLQGASVMNIQEERWNQTAEGSALYLHRQSTHK